MGNVSSNLEAVGWRVATASGSGGVGDDSGEVGVGYDSCVQGRAVCALTNQQRRHSDELQVPNVAAGRLEEEPVQVVHREVERLISDLLVDARGHLGKPIDQDESRLGGDGGSARASGTRGAPRLLARALLEVAERHRVRVRKLNVARVRVGAVDDEWRSRGQRALDRWDVEETQCGGAVWGGER